jgi:hypothetical protein
VEALKQILVFIKLEVQSSSQMPLAAMSILTLGKVAFILSRAS